MCHNFVIEPGQTFASGRRRILKECNYVWQFPVSNTCILYNQSYTVLVIKVGSDAVSNNVFFIITKLPYIILEKIYYK